MSPSFSVVGTQLFRAYAVLISGTFKNTINSYNPRTTTSRTGVVSAKDDNDRRHNHINFPSVRAHGYTVVVVHMTSSFPVPPRFRRDGAVGWRQRCCIPSDGYPGIENKSTAVAALLFVLDVPIYCSYPVYT